MINFQQFELKLEKIKSLKVIFNNILICSSRVKKEFKIS